MFNELVSNAMHSTPQGFVGVSLIFVYFCVIVATAFYRIKKAITCTTKRRRLPGLSPFSPNPDQERIEWISFPSGGLCSASPIRTDWRNSQPFCTPTAWSSSPPAGHAEIP